jgi:hypothetical protein
MAGSMPPPFQLDLLPASFDGNLEIGKVLDAAALEFSLTP